MTSEQLFYDKKTGFDKLTGSDKRNMTAYAEEYKKFLNEAKTEREACAAAVRMAEEKGFAEYRFGDPLAAGDKRYFVNRGKRVVLFRIGVQNLEEAGLRILVARIATT